MTIYIKKPDGTVTNLLVTPFMQVKFVKVLLGNKTGIPKHEQRLHFQVTQLEDKRTLNHYNIKHESRLNLTLRISGGGKRARAATVAAGGSPMSASFEGDLTMKDTDPDVLKRCFALQSVDIEASIKPCATMSSRPTAT